ncbi:hypothetical protein MM239_18340 [Belliella sp. DSM 111904]|uniref:Uncharacterized protein n=1 Tax=Belliella filtrata TaxID=2923435 RepID=A0ABS9V4M4_9BACT|nr:hypothetical protein [Belliella filtrata]MCH7411361.1 hypothetical protein [Belliella filtrata]
MFWKKFQPFYDNPNSSSFAEILKNFQVVFHRCNEPLSIPIQSVPAFRGKVYQHSEAKYTSIPKESIPEIPGQSIPFKDQTMLVCPLVCLDKTCHSDIKYTKNSEGKYTT